MEKTLYLFDAFIVIGKFLEAQPKKWIMTGF